ncbi:MAG: glycosyltransferase family 2 protein [Bacteroidia bacterium]|nr:glycosyltransferase family 2 protein [Bacteroidia bacterium]
MRHQPLVSIITITYNAGATLERTIESVRRQDYTNIEYIVVDGSSKDRTLDIVRENQDIITSYISEPDKGIYDAMNKGLRLAKGDYIWYMNSGDEIAEASTLSKAIKDAPEEADVIYGETIVTDMAGNTIGERRLALTEPLTWKSFRKGMVVCHQSFIAKKILCEEYDTRYRYSADFDWCLDILKKSEKIYDSQMVLSRFLDGGFTKQHIIPGLRERFRIMMKYYGVIKTILYHIPITIKFFSYWIAKGRF